MPFPTNTRCKFAKTIAMGALALGLAHSAAAEVYDFNTFLRGGGGGNVPERKRIVGQAGADICVDIREGKGSAGTVVFTLWSQMSNPKARVRAMVLDTGRHTGLFSNIAVLFQSPGLKSKLVPPKADAFLYNLSPAHWIEIEAAKYDPGNPPGIGPGKIVVLSATLGSGRTFASAMSALREGLNPATAAKGLRVGVIATHIAGGPLPGTTATISDDGGYLITGVSSRCRAR